MSIVKSTIDPKNPPKMTAGDKARYDAICDQDIDYSDIPEMDDEFLKRLKKKAS